MGYAFLSSEDLPDSEILGFAIMNAQIRDAYLNPQEQAVKDHVQYWLTPYMGCVDCDHPVNTIAAALAHSLPITQEDIDIGRDSHDSFYVIQLQPKDVPDLAWIH